MTERIVALRPVERVRQDSAPIALMYRNMGTAVAEQVVSRALAELSLTMAALIRLEVEGRAADLARQLRRLQRMAEQLGLVSLGQVAADMRHSLDGCAGAGCGGSGREGPARAAVWARLLRVAESSLVTDTGMLDRRP